MADEIPKIKDLLDGVIICSSCGSKISISDYEPLQIGECPSCSVPNFIPAQLQGYWLFRPLGSGGMGSVYLALSENVKGEFAVKILPTKFKTDPNLIRNLLREGEIGKVMGKHPNIVELTDYGVENDENFIATRLADGTRLDILISSAGQLSERQSIDILRQVLAAEIHITECGFLFRDIKPENIMILKGKKTVVKLYDFGLCLSMEEAANPDPNDSLEGSPFYLPPERVVAAAEGEYSEVYSLGMLFFHMLTGTTYFSQSEIKELMGKHVASLRMASVSNRLKHCSPAVAAVVDKMIKRNPNDRYHDFASLKEALDGLEGDASGFPLQNPAEDVDANDDGEVEGVARPRRKHKNSKMVSIITLVVVLLLGGGFGYWMHMEAEKEKKIIRELTQTEAAKLGISPDVAPPDVNEVQVYALLEKRKREIVAAEVAKLPKYDEKAVRAKICAARNIVDSDKMKKPIPLAKVKKLVAKEVDKVIKKKIADSVKPFPEKLIAKMIANKLKISYPVVKPDISLKELKSEINTELMVKVKSKFPPEPLRREISKIMKKYKSYRKGDRISVPTKAGGTVKGVYQGLQGRYVIVDGVDISLADLPPTVRLKFNPSLVGKKTRFEISRAKAMFKEKRDAYMKPLAAKEFAELAPKHGYFLYKGKWVPAYKLFDAMVDKKRKEYEASQAKKQIAMIEKTKKSFDSSKLYLSYGYTKKGKK
ncbi:MAG: serine/threonine protein kinase, partial [Victivallales bacterium]|nr:serine/threonine protein kinase [Victivallales bacterium]